MAAVECYALEFDIAGADRGKGTMAYILERCFLGCKYDFLSYLFEALKLFFCTYYTIKIFSFNRRQRKERHNKTGGRADHSRGLWDSYLNVRKEAAGIPPADVLVRIGRDPSYHDSFRQMRKKAAQRIEACEEVREI